MIPEATRLRLAGLLWPQSLTDDELIQQYAAARSDTQPISSRMLRDELAKRGKIKL